MLEEELSKCSYCGLCKANCPTYRVLLTELASPRGKMILSKKKALDKVFYLCTLCRACEVKCPAGVKICEEMQKVRETLAKEGVETEAGKRMIENIRKYGNPFGEIKDGKTPKDLFCC
jgi:Fe-S oxidoreductase